MKQGHGNTWNVMENELGVMENNLGEGIKKFNRFILMLENV